MKVVNKFIAMIILCFATIIFSFSTIANLKEDEMFAARSCKLKGLTELTDEKLIPIHSTKIAEETIFVTTFEKYKISKYDSSIVTKTGLELTQEFRKNADTSRIVQITKINSNFTQYFYWFLWDDLNVIMIDATEMLQQDSIIDGFETKNKIFTVQAGKYGSFIYWNMNRIQGMSLLSNNGGHRYYDTPMNTETNKIKDLLLILNGIEDNIIQAINDADNLKYKSK
jgi:hypothetical protein